MAEQIALNCDCMEYMRTVPDKYFDKSCERFKRETTQSTLF